MILSPTEIKAQLDQYVVGQGAAKRTLSVAVSNHYRAVAYEGEVTIGKSNVLLIGPTGSGKTHLMRTVARILEVPFAEMNATTITPAGWFGSKAETVILDLYHEAKRKYGKDAFKKARVGIAYLDEIDKISGRGVQHASESAFNTTQVQQALLRVIEGIEIVVDGNPLDTAGILFVGSGAFVGLDVVVQTREHGGRFTRSVRDVNILKRTLPQDLLAFGYIPEFVGRFPVVGVLEALTEDHLVAVLRDVKDSLIAQCQALLSTTGCELDIEEAVLRNLARAALAQGTGARGLRTSLEKLLEPCLFNLQSNTRLVIDQTGIKYLALPSPASPYSARLNPTLASENNAKLPVASMGVLADPTLAGEPPTRELVERSTHDA